MSESSPSTLCLCKVYALSARASASPARNIEHPKKSSNDRSRGHQRPTSLHPRPSRIESRRLLDQGEALSRTPSLSERTAFLALNLLPFHPVTLRRILDARGSARSALLLVSDRAFLSTLLQRSFPPGRPKGFGGEGVPSGGDDSGARVEGFGEGQDVPGAGPWLLEGTPDDGSQSPGARAGDREAGDRDREAGIVGFRELAQLGLGGLLALATREEERARSLGLTIVSLADDEYPALLREIPDPPPILYIWGRLDPDDEVRVAVVGARRATRHGLGASERIARGLGLRGVTIVSGLARGIDGAAHAGALQAGARTIAVLGSGLGRIYPSENRPLARRIAAEGAVISEYPIGLGPLPHLFPRRNRVVSGLAAGTVVVEAGAASGALGTARLAVDQGREVFVVPGGILDGACAGSNGLLVDGAAHVVTGAGDVLKELPAVFRVRLGLPASPLDETPDPGSAARRPRRRPAEGGGPLGSPSGSPPADPLEGDSGPEGFSSLASEWLAGSCAREGGGRRSSGGGQDAPGATEWSADLRAEGAGALSLDADARCLLKRLTYADPLEVDELVADCRLPVGRLFAALSRLEILGLAEALPGGRIALTKDRSV